MNYTGSRDGHVLVPQKLTYHPNRHEGARLNVIKPTKKTSSRRQFLLDSATFTMSVAQAIRQCIGIWALAFGMRDHVLNAL